MHPTSITPIPKHRHGYTLKSDIGEIPLITTMDGLALVAYLKRGENYLKGPHLQRRAMELGANLGQYHAAFIYLHQDKIPLEWRSFLLIFPGTLWKDRREYVRLECLTFNEKSGWEREMRWWESNVELTNGRFIHIPIEPLAT